MRFFTGFILILMTQILSGSAHGARQNNDKEVFGIGATSTMDKARDFTASIRSSLNAKRDHLLDLRMAHETAKHGATRLEQTLVSPLATAISRAAKKSAIELDVEASTDVIAQCQRASSPALTTPFMRSDSQQAHCYRY